MAKKVKFKIGDRVQFCRNRLYPDRLGIGIIKSIDNGYANIECEENELHVYNRHLDEITIIRQ